MGTTSIPLGPFTDGVNLVDPVTRLTERELRRCQNFRTGVRGDFYKRPGHGNYGNAPAKINGDALVNLVCRYYKADGSKLLIGAAGGKLRKGNDTTGAWTDISIDGSGASMNVDNLCDWMVYKDRLYITDGTRPQRYDTVNDWYVGSLIPTSSVMTATEGAGGSLTLLGRYRYIVTYVAGDLGEGPADLTTYEEITLTGANNKVTLNLIPTAAAGHGVTARRIYRTIANQTIFKLLTTIEDNVTTTFVDTIADTALGVEYIPTSNPPATARFVIVGHDERTYWSGMTASGDQSLVRVSDIGFPDRVINADFFTVANNDGDIITGCGLVPGGIIYFKKTSMWLLRAFGYGLINIFPREKRGSGVGTTSPFSVVTTPIGLIFLSQRGEVYKFDGTNIEEIGRKVFPEFRGMNSSTMGRVVACYHDYRYIISYDYNNAKGYNYRTLEYDTITGKWEGPHENGLLYTPSYYSVWDSVIDKGELYWGEARAAAGSYVYGRTTATKTDRGNKFSSVARTGSRALVGLGEVNSVKVFVHGEYTADATLIATHIDEKEVRTSVNLNVPVSYIASKLNGTDNLGPGAAPIFKLGGSVSQVLEGSFGPSARSRVPCFEFSDGGTAVEVKMNEFSLLAEGLPLK